MGRWDQLIRDGITELTPYITGKTAEEIKADLGLAEVIQMSTNETAIGPSPLAVAAIEKEAARVNYYSDGPSDPLCEKLAQRLGLKKEMFIIANGADNIISIVSAAFIAPGDEVILSEVTYPVYPRATRIMGGVVVPVPLINGRNDLEAMADRINSRTKLVFICNPNNPTGAINTRVEIDRFLQKIPQNVLVVMDEAYCDFVEDDAYPNSIDYFGGDTAVIGIRTFSKISGIAGVHIGYALAEHELIGFMQRVAEAYPVNRLAQAAALAALDDENHRRSVLRFNREGKTYFYEAFEKMNLRPIRTETNFITVDVKTDSVEVYEKMVAKGVIIRPLKAWGCPESIRITIGRPGENEKCIRALRKVLQG